MANETPHFKSRQSRALFRNLIFSILVHCLFFLGALFTPKKLFETTKKEVVQIDFTEPPQVETPKPLQSDPKQKPIIRPEKQQVVDQDEKPLNDEKPTDERFLSAHNQVVKKQTIAKNHGEFKNAKTQNSDPGTGGKTNPKPLSVEDLKPQFDIAKAIDSKLETERIMEQKAEENALKVFEEKKALKQLAQSKPPAGDNTNGNSGAQTSQSIDYIKDLDPGLETLLSTKEFVYYTYYARIRRQLNQHWGPKVREKIAKLYRSGRSIASNEDRVTKLLISLDKKGNLVRAQVIGDSGVRDLDEAAVESFRAAAPFPNPPEGMVDPDGQIKVRWDFILEA